MICPKCQGYGYWYGWVGHNFICRPCNYPGCHAGKISCCDGLQEPAERQQEFGL